MVSRFLHIIRRFGAVLLLASMGLFVSPAVPAAGAETSPVVPGTIDLGAWDFETDKLASLAGEWTVFRGQILDPSEAIAFRGETGQPVNVPDLWGDAFTLKLSSGHGSATYVVRVKVPAGSEEMALGPLNMRLIAGIYAHVPGADGTTGEIYHLTQSADPSSLSDVHANAIPLPFVAEQFDLIFQLSNNVHKQGGVIQAPEIGQRRYVEATVGSRRAVTMSIVVLLGMMALAGFAVGLVAPKGKIFYFFSFFAAIAAARALLTGLVMIDFFPDLSLARRYDLEYLTFFLFPPAVYAFFASLFPEDNFRTFQRIVNGLTAPMVMFAVFVTPWVAPGAVTLLREPSQLLAMALIFGATVLSVKAFRNRRRDSGIALSSVLIMTVMALIEFSFYTGFQPQIVHATQVGLVIVGLMFSGSMILRFGRLQAEREAINRRLREQAEELEIAHSKATSASEAKSNFLAVVSHEIRTPLTGMIGMSGILEEEVTDNEHSRLMGSVRRSGEGLLGLLNDVLDLSKIEAGAIELEQTPFTLSGLVEQIDDLWQCPMREKDLAFNILCSYPDNQGLIGDEGRIRQVLHNLIGNARKFTASGSVTLEISGTNVSDELAELTFAVKDSGIGIPVEKQEQVFGKFNQADSSTSRQYGGTGLGLAICKDFAALMGGSIGVKSAPNEGSTFHFTIPCKIGAQTVKDDAPSDIAGVPDRSLQILVAEDVSLNQEVIRRLLNKMGHEVEMVSNGQEAVDACKAGSFDLVLMDLQMPELDGISATRMIRALSTPMRGVPIFALTANLVEDVRVETDDAGMNGLVTKPIVPDELSRAIHAVIPGVH